jgi:hypothetical protein
VGSIVEPCPDAWQNENLAATSVETSVGLAFFDKVFDQGCDKVSDEDYRCLDHAFHEFSLQLSAVSLVFPGSR